MSRYQSINLPPIRCRDQIHTLPPMKLREESQADKLGVEWQEPDHQRLQPLRYSEPSSELPTEEGWRTSAPTRNSGGHPILNSIEPDGSAALRLCGPNLATGSPLSTVGPAVPSISTIHTFSGQKQLSNISPRADGNTGTLARGGRGILTPKSASQATGAQRPVLPENAESLPFSPASERECMAKPRPPTSYVVPPMPTPPTQSNEQQYESPSSSWPSTTDSVHSSGSIIQALTSPASSLYSKVGRPQQIGNSDYPESSFGTTVRQEGLIPPERPYFVPATQSQDHSFHSSDVDNSRHTSASDPIRVLSIPTSEGLFDIPVNVHHGSKVADEKRARNAGASARFRQRRKERETEAKSSIEKLQSRTIELEGKLREVGQQRDFYRADRDRLRDVVFETPGLRHHAMYGPPSPQSMRSATLQGLMPQIVDPHLPPQTAFHTTDSTSKRPSKRRRKSTQGGYTSTEDLPPATTDTFVPAGFPPRPTLPLQQTAPSALFPSTTRPRNDIRDHSNEVNKSHYTPLFGPLDGTQHTSHRLHTNISFNFPTSNPLFHNVSRMVVPLI